MAGFVIPNHSSASYADQAEIDSLDWLIVLDALSGAGIFTGCTVTAQGTPDGRVALAAGTYRVPSSDKTWAGGNISVLSGAANSDGSTALAADDDWPRYDLIVVNSANQAGVVHGTAMPPTFDNGIISNPVFPAYSRGAQVVVAAVYVVPIASVSHTDNIILTADITTKDVRISRNAFYDQAHAISGANHTGEISNAQHGIRSIASAHAHSHLSGVGISDHGKEVLFAKSGALAVSTGPFRWYNKTGKTLTFTAITASVGTAPTGATLIVDVNKNGTTIMTGTKVVIATSGFVVTQTTFSTTTIADGDYVSVDVDQIGSTIAGSDLVVEVRML